MEWNLLNRIRLSLFLCEVDCLIWSSDLILIYHLTRLALHNESVASNGSSGYAVFVLDYNSNQRNVVFERICYDLSIPDFISWKFLRLFIAIRCFSDKTFKVKYCLWLVELYFPVDSFPWIKLNHKKFLLSIFILTKHQNLSCYRRVVIICVDERHKAPFSEVNHALRNVVCKVNNCYRFVIRLIGFIAKDWIIDYVALP